MKPRIFRKDDTTRNFGDELNLLLWENLIPTMEWAKPGVLYGIGTLLHEPFSDERPAIVFGSGAGYGPAPDLTGVDVRFVRGPKTAAVYKWKYPWITDPAILTRHLMPTVPLDRTIPCGFMPHWMTMQQDPGMVARLKEVGITVIDPLGPVWATFYAILSCEKLISEALHGAIVADTARVPWIPAYLSPNHMFKWFDWTQSMDVPYNPIDLGVCPVTFAFDQHFLLSDQTMLDYKMGSMDEQLDRLRKELA